MIRWTVLNPQLIYDDHFAQKKIENYVEKGWEFSPILIWPKFSSRIVWVPTKYNSFVAKSPLFQKRSFYKINSCPEISQFFNLHSVAHRSSISTIFPKWGMSTPQHRESTCASLRNAANITVSGSIPMSLNSFSLSSDFHTLLIGDSGSTFLGGVRCPPKMPITG